MRPTDSCLGSHIREEGAGRIRTSDNGKQQEQCSHCLDSTCCSRCLCSRNVAAYLSDSGELPAARYARASAKCILLLPSPLRKAASRCSIALFASPCSR